MTIFEQESTAKELDQETSFRNTTHIQELDVFLRRTGHPEVEQHMQTAVSAANLVLKESVYTD